MVGGTPSSPNGQYLHPVLMGGGWYPHPIPMGEYLPSSPNGRVTLCYLPHQPDESTPPLPSGRMGYILSGLYGGTPIVIGWGYPTPSARWGYHPTAVNRLKILPSLILRMRAVINKLKCNISVIFRDWKTEEILFNGMFWGYHKDMFFTMDSIFIVISWEVLLLTLRTTSRHLTFLHKRLFFFTNAQLMTR